jgi:hypothetical protein
MAMQVPRSRCQILQKEWDDKHAHLFATVTDQHILQASSKQLTKPYDKVVHVLVTKVLGRDLDVLPSQPLVPEGQDEQAFRQQWGNGVFLTKDAAKGDIVAWYWGTFLNREDCLALLQKGLQSHIRKAGQPTGLYIDGCKDVEKCMHRGVAQFANDHHGSGYDMNCSFGYLKVPPSLFGDGTLDLVVLRATKDLKAPCELWTNYGRNYMVQAREFNNEHEEETEERGDEVQRGGGMEMGGGVKRGSAGWTRRGGRVSNTGGIRGKGRRGRNIGGGGRSSRGRGRNTRGAKYENEGEDVPVEADLNEAGEEGNNDAQGRIHEVGGEKENGGGEEEDEEEGVDGDGGVEGEEERGKKEMGDKQEDEEQREEAGGIQEKEGTVEEGGGNKRDGGERRVYERQERGEDDEEELGFTIQCAQKSPSSGGFALLCNTKDHSVCQLSSGDEGDHSAGHKTNVLPLKRGIETSSVQCEMNSKRVSVSSCASHDPKKVNVDGYRGRDKERATPPSVSCKSKWDKTGGIEVIQLVSGTEAIQPDEPLGSVQEVCDTEAVTEVLTEVVTIIVSTKTDVVEPSPSVCPESPSVQIVDM